MRFLIKYQQFSFLRKEKLPSVNKISIPIKKKVIMWALTIKKITCN